MCVVRVVETVLIMGVFINFNWGGPKFVSTLGGVITWHRAVECLASVGNCVIYILPLLLSYKYDDIVVFTC